MWKLVPTFIILALHFFPAIIIAQSCSSGNLVIPPIPGIEITQIVANPVYGHAISGPYPLTIDFCNVTVVYTHTSWNDSIGVYVWLPLANWNGRLQGIGGGGFAGLTDFTGHESAVASNYSAVGTDTGHIMNALYSSSWSLDDSGKVNFGLLHDFTAVALNDAALIAKAISESHYGQAPKKSYWNGCSTGGRQGLMLAQRYPHTYDGILAAAPAINWAKFIVAEYWPQFVMNNLKSYPHPCLLQYVQNATIAACDAIDGVEDGIITSPKTCNFQPQTLVGQRVNCGSFSLTVTSEAATIAAETWQGPQSSTGASMWYGLEPGSSFSGLANTTCTSSTNCTSNPFPISTSWISEFVLQDPTFEFSSISQAMYESIFQLSISFYDPIISTNNPDLFDFKSAGGKMITWHGLVDQLIPPRGTSHYYDAVEARDPNVRDFYRFFEAPGVEHCQGGIGPMPVDPLQSVVEWVEEGIAPDTLYARSGDGAKSRNLCPYPLVSAYKGGDPALAGSFACQKSF